MERRNGKIVNIDGSKRGDESHPNKPKKRSSGGFRPQILAGVIIFIVFVYILVNIFFYITKDKVSIYEVQGDDISVETGYRGIAVRDEHIVTSDCSGYINYFVQNGKKTTNNGVVFSVDESKSLHSKINENYGIDKLTEDEVKSIKNLIYGYVGSYSSAEFYEVTEFEKDISDSIFEIVNDASIENMYELRDYGSTSSFHVKRSSYSGVVSYYFDNLCGCTFEDINADMFKPDYNVNREYLKSRELIKDGDRVYRIIPNEEWQIVVNIPESLYQEFVYKTSISFYINDYFQPMTADLRIEQKEDAYYAILTLDEYMSMFVDERILEIEFNEDNDSGLKIPLSAVATKNFYLVPLTMFIENEDYNGNVLLREGYDQASGSPIYEVIHAQKFFSDGTYAYIDMDILKSGDHLVNTETGESFYVKMVNSLEGVYNVNKGYYQFVRIEKMRQNNEYAIIKKDTPDGLRLYDHIALKAEDAKDKDIIY